MELVKRKNTPNDAPCTLKDNQQYSERLARLERLTSDLERHKARREQLKLQSRRHSAQVRELVSKEAACLPMLSDTEFDDLASKAATGSEDLLSQITTMRKAAKDSGRMSTPRLGEYADAQDYQFLDDLGSERACVLVLERSLELAKKDLARIKHIAMAEVMTALRPKHDAISRKLATALVAMGAALKEESRFARELEIQDPSFVDALDPKPLSHSEILTSPAVTAWIAGALKSGVIDEETAFGLAG